MRMVPLPESQEILDFIKNFKGSEAVFSNGCSYWFAFILSTRFRGGAIVLHPSKQYFLFCCGSQLYDIHGDVTDLYAGETILDWSMMRYTNLDLRDKLIRERVQLV